MINFVVVTDLQGVTHHININTSHIVEISQFEDKESHILLSTGKEVVTSVDTETLKQGAHINS